ncbi:Uncharacterized protein ALO79_04312 [Pseudomonas syringae pv. castaneae]|uniref:Uncharacterized protein n=1 Tax=Pseudomonas syringae pv. castaneae TaxID=264450 RepID=A0A0P9S239_PSESX|nr:Uncharacterized protein ALO79_04312 [Pseudomonas syringae pv. castaneae]
MPSGAPPPNIRTHLAREMRRDEPAKASSMGSLSLVDINLAGSSGHGDICHPSRLNPVA